jgi:hypothetical protein
LGYVFQSFAAAVIKRWKRNIMLPLELLPAQPMELARRHGPRWFGVLRCCLTVIGR